MLPSPPSTTSDLAVTGVSAQWRTGVRGRSKTAKHEGFWGARNVRPGAGSPSSTKNDSNPPGVTRTKVRACSLSSVNRCGMSRGQKTKEPGRGREHLIPDAHSKRSLEDEERLVLTVMNVRWGLIAFG